jgi:hypothetical protein
VIRIVYNSSSTVFIDVVIVVKNLQKGRTWTLLLLLQAHAVTTTIHSD